MAKQQKRRWIDDLADRAREFLDNLERLLQPRREPVRVPVPVRIPKHHR
jgi:hypothetical protein